MDKSEIIKTEKDNKNKSFEDFLIILVTYRKSIIINVLIITIAATIVSLLIENRYTATTSFIAPKKKSSLLGDVGGFSSTIKDLSKSLGGRLGNVTDEAYNYLVILQSRRASDSVIKKFDLRRIYKIDKDKPYEDVITTLEENVDFNVEDEGNIVVSVNDNNAVRASRIANYYIQVLNNISLELSISEAKSNREFIEKRFLQLQSDILRIEDSLKVFSEKYHVFEIEEQSKAVITVAAELKAQVEIARLERDILSKRYGDENPLVQQANYKLAELKNQLSTMKNGENENNNSLDVFIPFKNIPEVGIQYLRLKRDYEIQTKIMEFLYPIYEQAKIEEQKNIPVVLVIDKAYPPEKKTSPKRTIIVIVAFVIALFFSIVYALLKNFIYNIKNDKIRYSRIENKIFRPLRTTFKRID